MKKKSNLQIKLNLKNISGGGVAVGLNEFECDMVFDARLVGLNISETADQLGSTLGVLGARILSD